MGAGDMIGTLILGICIGWFLGICSVFVAILWAYRKGATGW